MIRHSYHFDTNKIRTRIILRRVKTRTRIILIRVKIRTRIILIRVKIRTRNSFGGFEKRMNPWSLLKIEIVSSSPECRNLIGHSV